jgi:hypothetical protein
MKSGSDGRQIEQVQTLPSKADNAVGQTKLPGGFNQMMAD